MLRPSISHGMHRGNLPGVSSYIRQLLAQLHNRLVERPRGPIVFVSPDFIENAVAGQHLIRVSDKNLEESGLASGNGNRLFSSSELQRFQVERAVAESHAAHLGR